MQDLFIHLQINDKVVEEFLWNIKFLVNLPTRHNCDVNINFMVMFISSCGILKYEKSYTENPMIIPGHAKKTQIKLFLWPLFFSWKIGDPCEDLLNHKITFNDYLNCGNKCATSTNSHSSCHFALWYWFREEIMHFGSWKSNNIHKLFPHYNPPLNPSGNLLINKPLCLISFEYFVFFSLLFLVGFCGRGKTTWR